MPDKNSGVRPKWLSVCVPSPSFRPSSAPPIDKQSTINAFFTPLLRTEYFIFIQSPPWKNPQILDVTERELVEYLITLRAVVSAWDPRSIFSFFLSFVRSVTSRFQVSEYSECSGQHAAHCSPSLSHEAFQNKTHTLPIPHTDSRGFLWQIHTATVH